MAPWTPWTECSRGCDYGTRQRSQSCSGGGCLSAETKEREYCFQSPCGTVEKGMRNLMKSNDNLNRNPSLFMQL